MVFKLIASSEAHSADLELVFTFSLTNVEKEQTWSLFSLALRDRFGVNNVSILFAMNVLSWVNSSVTAFSASERRNCGVMQLAVGKN